MKSIEKLSNLTLNITDGKHGDCTNEQNSGYYFVSSKDIYNGHLNLDDARQITIKDYEEAHKRTKLEPNDILITNSGTIGKICFIKPTNKTNNITFQKSVAIIKPNPKKVIPKYLYYNFSYNTNLLIRSSVGSNQKNLLLSDLRDLNIQYYKDKKVQQKIADYLSILDNKIELNNKINEELEQMARMYFDYWFVQFDFPNEKGKPYKTSGGEMIYNEELKREIPKNWKVRNIEQIENQIVTGKTPSSTKKEYYNGKIPFIMIPDIRDSIFIVNSEKKLSKLGADSQSNKYLPKGSICVSCIASPGLVGFTNEVSQTNQQINSIICNDEKNKYYLFFAIKSFSEFSFGAKTGNTFANMNKEEFAKIKLIYPNLFILNEFHKTLTTVFNIIRNKCLETKELTQIRDFLLPLLMNGQVKVN